MTLRTRVARLERQKTAPPDGVVRELRAWRLSADGLTATCRKTGEVAPADALPSKPGTQNVLERRVTAAGSL